MVISPPEWLILWLISQLGQQNHNSNKLTVENVTLFYTRADGPWNSHRHRTWPTPVRTMTTTAQSAHSLRLQPALRNCAAPEVAGSLNSVHVPSSAAQVRWKRPHDELLHRCSPQTIRQAYTQTVQIFLDVVTRLQDRVSRTTQAPIVNEL